MDPSAGPLPPLGLPPGEPLELPPPETPASRGLGVGEGVLAETLYVIRTNQSLIISLAVGVVLKKAAIILRNFRFTWPSLLSKLSWRQRATFFVKKTTAVAAYLTTFEVHP